MRLIDADALYSEIGNITPVDIHDLAYQTLKAIKNAPTAYDVEKVVEQIHDYFCKVIDDCEEDIVPHELLEYNKAICEIVRSGGVE